MNTRGPAMLVWTMALVLGAAGCVEDDRSFLIRQNQVPGSGCQVTTGTAEFQATGLLDVSVNYGYRLFPLIENNMSPTAGDGEPERNTLRLRKIKVSLDLDEIPGNFPDELLDFSIPISGTLAPGGKIAIAGVEIMRAELVQMLPNLESRHPYVMVSVSVVADRTGSDLESGTFLYPIELCESCLVDFRPSCPTVDGGEAVITNACGLPQESPVTCCVDPATNRTTCLSEAK